MTIYVIQWFVVQAVIVWTVWNCYRVAMGVVSIFHSKEQAQAEAVAHGAGRYYLDDDNKIVFRWHPARVDSEVQK